MVAVAVAQFAPGVDKLANLLRARELAASAARRGARVVVLPEYAMFTAPAMDQRFLDSAEPLDGPYVSGLLKLARELGVYLVAGVNESLPERTRLSNTLVVAGPDAELVSLYRKLHLYDAFGFTESAVVRPGDITAPPVFTVENITFGLQTCYDLRFPEVTRRIADAGAQAVIVPAEWVPGPLKEEHWRTLVHARAIENTLYVAASAQSTPTGAGNSMIVDPMGSVVTSLGEQEGVAVGEVDAERVAKVRTVNPALRLRRFEVVPQS